MPSTQPAGQPLRQEMTFCRVYCESTKCPEAQFAREVLLTCLHTPLLGKFLWRLDPEYFHADLELIRLLGDTTSFAEFRHELEAFRHAHPPAGIMRKRFRVRVSGQRLLKFASKLFLRSSLAARVVNQPR